MPIVIPTVTTGVESLVLDGLDLSQGEGGAIRLDSFTPPLFKKRVEWVEAADSNGAILARDPLESVGDATVRVAVVGVSRDDAQSTVGQIVGKLEEAERNPLGIPLVWTPSDSTTSVTAYVLTGEVTEMPVDWESGYMVNQPLVTFTLSCRPGWYGAPVTYTKTATAGPLVTMDLADVPGDVPADATLTVTDASSQSRRTVEWGAEQRRYNPSSPAALVLDSDNLVTTGFAGTQATFSGAYDPGASGTNVIDCPVYLNSPVAVCGTGAQPHIGTFRVKARIYFGGRKQIRFSWQAGDGPFTANDWVASINPSVAGWFEYPLGLITIPEATVGTQTWTGRIEAYEEVAPDQIHVDYLMLIPVEAGYGKATASYSYSPGVVVSRDSFTGIVAGSALNTRTPDAGAAWVTSGVATDFTGVTVLSGATVAMVGRSTSVVESEGRAAAFGSAMTNQEVQAAGVMTNPGVSQRFGVIARYVDDDNYLWLRQFGFYVLEIVKKVAGVETQIASKFTPGIGTQVWFSLVTFASGRVIGSVGTSPGTITHQIEATDSVLASGGVLASGKGGIADQMQATTAGVSRYFDDVNILTPPAEPLAIASGRSLRVGYDDTIRESAAGGTWGRPQTYRGSRFRVQPAGTADRTTRVAVKASRNDLDTAEDLNLTDTISLGATVTPRYSVVPRA